MKQVTKTYSVYTFDELSQEAKDKARATYNESESYPFLQADLREYLHEELTDLGYTHDEITPLYDLSHSQGSGLMFEGTIIDKEQNTYNIKQSGHYYHEKSTNITAYDKEGNTIDQTDFEENVYIPLCKTIRDKGYEQIQYMESEESFAQACEANEYTFLEDGTMSNE